MRIKNLLSIATAVTLAVSILVSTPMSAVAKTTNTTKVTQSKTAAKKIKLNKTSATIYVGDTLKLSLKNAPAKKVKWTSSNAKIATVKNGSITSKSAGDAVITAKYNKKSYKCKVKVSNEIIVEKVAVLNNDNNWEFMHRFDNTTNLTLKLVKVEIDDVINGKIIDTLDATEFFSDIIGSYTPQYAFGTGDMHPFTKDFNQRNYRFIFEDNYNNNFYYTEIWKLFSKKGDYTASLYQEDLKNLNFPSDIAKQNLSVDRAMELVGSNSKTIQKEVKSLADAFLYLKVAEFGKTHTNTYTPWYNGWGFDHPGDLELSYNDFTCCQGMANVLAYLLQGDYDEVGFIRWIGGGNHVINYVYTNGSYYVFDFTLYCCDGQWLSNVPQIVTQISSLSEYFNVWPDTYRASAEQHYKDFPNEKRGKEPIMAMIAFACNSNAAYPDSWDEATATFYYPCEAKGKITLIYRDPNQKNEAVIFKDVNTSIPGYNADISGTKFTP